MKKVGLATDALKPFDRESQQDRLIRLLDEDLRASAKFIEEDLFRAPTFSQFSNGSRERTECALHLEEWDGPGSCSGCDAGSPLLTIANVAKAQEQLRDDIGRREAESWVRYDPTAHRLLEHLQSLLPQDRQRSLEIARDEIKGGQFTDAVRAQACARMDEVERTLDSARSRRRSFEVLQREDYRIGGPSHRAAVMSDRDLALASEDWSARLREKVKASSAAAAERERTQVVVDLDW